MAMNKRSWLRIALAAVVAPVIAQWAPPARAQFGGIGGGFPGGSSGGRRAGRDRPDRDDRPGTRDTVERPRVSNIEVSLQELHEDLKLAGTQEAAWQSYVDRVR